MLPQSPGSGAMLGRTRNVAVNGRCGRNFAGPPARDLNVTQKELGRKPEPRTGHNAMLGPETALRY